MSVTTSTGSSGGSAVKNPPAKQVMGVLPLGQKDHLEKGMTTHSSILAWEILWIEEPGGLPSMGLQRVGHDLGINQQQPLQQVNLSSLEQ